MAASQSGLPLAPAEVQVGDIIQTRKTHPCGSDQWRVYRIGADYGLCCLGCDRRVMLPYRQFAKAMKKLIAQANPKDTSDTSR